MARATRPERPVVRVKTVNTSEGPATETTGGTDFESLQRDLERAAAERAARAAREKHATDFATLKKQLANDEKPYQFRTLTDWLIDFLTPFMIFWMMWSIVFFLLDVRFIYTETHDAPLRTFAASLILGVVALNRLIAREGSEESILYIVLLVGFTGLFTLTTTSMYGVGSVARGFLDRPGWSMLFNMAVVALLWWVTNRLVHECCVDENRTAGDVGILTGTARRIQRAIARDDSKAKPAWRGRSEKYVIEMNDLEAVDPLEWKPPEERKAKPPSPATARLPERHPGISIFYVSIPVMIIFAVGLSVLLQGGPAWVFRGHTYVAVYTVSALALLMLTSLSGLREYFRSRRIYFPRAIGVFWVGLGMVMIAMVTIGALKLPMPSNPGLVRIEQHETDYWSRGSQFRLQKEAKTFAELERQTHWLDTIGTAVLIVFAGVGAMALVRGLGAIAAMIARRRDRYPAFVVRFFNRLDAVLLRLTRLPVLPERQGRVRISADVAMSARIRNPMQGEGPGSGVNVRGYVAASYEALCALAYDLGVPRRKDQTPYEFVRAFPKALEPLREEALELTDLYVRSAYSPEILDERVLDRLRKFWYTYEKVRNRVIK